MPEAKPTGKQVFGNPRRLAFSPKYCLTLEIKLKIIALVFLKVRHLEKLKNFVSPSPLSFFFLSSVDFPLIIFNKQIWNNFFF